MPSLPKQTVPSGNRGFAPVFCISGRMRSRAEFDVAGEAACPSALPDGRALPASLHHPPFLFAFFSLRFSLSDFSAGFFAFSLLITDAPESIIPAPYADHPCRMERFESTRHNEPRAVRCRGDAAMNLWRQLKTGLDWCAGGASAPPGSSRKGEGGMRCSVADAQHGENDFVCDLKADHTWKK